MISVNVKFFGPLRDVVMQDELKLDLPDPSTGDEAFERLVGLFPTLKQWKQSTRLAVNLEYVQLAHSLRAGDELCFIPPVSGG